MQQSSTVLTCAELLDRAAKIGMTDTQICNRAKAMKMTLARSTLWRIRKGKLKGNSYLSTLSKLAQVVAGG